MRIKQMPQRLKVENSRFRFLFLALILSLFAGLTSAQDDARIAATWQVVKYDIAATLPQAETDRNLTSKARLELKNVSSRPASTLTLRINNSAVVSAATVNGSTADFTKGEEKLG